MTYCVFVREVKKNDLFVARDFLCASVLLTLTTTKLAMLRIKMNGTCNNSMIMHFYFMSYRSTIHKICFELILEYFSKSKRIQALNEAKEV